MMASSDTLINDGGQMATSRSLAMIDALVEICEDNCKYFECDETEAGQRFFNAFRYITENAAEARAETIQVEGFMHEYDCDENTPANGYRSMVKVLHACINHTMKVCKYITQHRGHLLFRKTTYIKEIEACKDLIVSLTIGFYQVLKVKAKCDRGVLISPGPHDATALFEMSECVDQHPFYGRCIGFHYCDSMQVPMKFLAIGLAGFSEIYYNSNENNLVKATSSLYFGSKYYWNPELRAKRYLDLSWYAGVGFAKAFLSLTESELMHTLPSVFGAKIKVNELITIAPEPLEIENANEPKKMVKIPIPSSHLGVQPVTVRLLSSVRREGMIGNQVHTHPPSNCLLFHCHGGGFIAHTSKSHEIYLRDWAAELHVPIVSVDYSLSPKAPYPRALEEVFYAYCWAIKNAEVLGTTAERIIVVGDSAGGTLNMALTLKCIEESVRKPDGAFLVYSPMIVGFDPSPSRCLAGMDVMLPFGMLMACLKAYIHPGKDQSYKKKNETTNKSVKGDELEVGANGKPITKIDDKSHRRCLNVSPGGNLVDDYLFDVPQDPFISPLYATDEMLKQMPPIKFLTVDMDPFLDESVTMAKRLKLLGKEYGLDVLPGLPHGFLNFVKLSKDAYEGNRTCISRLAELLFPTTNSN